MRVRAVIQNNDKIILIHRKKKNQKEYWVFPGGGVNDNESPQEAIVRECKEELGIDVAVGKLASKFTNHKGEEEYCFVCTQKSGELGSGRGKEMISDDPDDIYIVEEIPTNKLKTIDLLPKELRDKVGKDSTWMN